MAPGVSALDLAPDTERMLTDSKAREAQQVAQRPTQPEQGPAAPTPQPLGGAAPAPASSPAPYNPEEGLRKHLQKQFPDMTPEHWDFAKNYYKSKVYQHNLKQLGSEHSAMLGSYLHDLMKTDAARRKVVANAEESKMLEKEYNDTIKKGGGAAVPGLIDPKNRPELTARYTRDAANAQAADAVRHEKFLKLDAFLKKKTGKGLDEEIMDPMIIKMMVHNAKGTGGSTEDDTEDLLKMMHDEDAAQ